MKIVSAEFIKSSTSLNNCPAWELYEVALAGRSNVGKSSFLNKMLSRRSIARTSNTPGRTRLINFFKINDSFSLVDLPGYGYARVPEKMRMDWGQSIREYLEKRKNLAGVVLLIDIRHGPTELDLQLYQWLAGFNIPAVPVVTKADKLSRNQAAHRLTEIRSALGLDAESPLIVFSAKTGQGREQAWDLIEALMKAGFNCQESEVRSQKSEVRLPCRQRHHNG